eukprot:Gb_32352 [translate_table: standard]
MKTKGLPIWLVGGSSSTLAPPCFAKFYKLAWRAYNSVIRVDFGSHASIAMASARNVEGLEKTIEEKEQKLDEWRGCNKYLVERYKEANTRVDGKDVHKKLEVGTTSSKKTRITKIDVGKALATEAINRWIKERKSFSTDIKKKGIQEIHKQAATKPKARDKSAEDGLRIETKYQNSKLSNENTKRNVFTRCMLDVQRNRPILANNLQEQIFVCISKHLEACEGHVACKFGAESGFAILELKRLPRSHFPNGAVPSILDFGWYHKAVGGSGAEQTVATGTMEVLKPCWAVATSGVPVREQLFNASICRHSPFGVFQHGEFSSRTFGRTVDSAPLEVATPILIPRSDGHRHRKGSHGDVIFLTSRGEVTSYSPGVHGQGAVRRWQLLTGATWSNLPSPSGMVEEKVVPTLEALPLRVHGPQEGILVAGEQEALIISPSGSQLTSMFLPSPPTQPILYGDFSNDGLNDLILVTSNGIYGFVQTRQPGALFFSSLVGCLIVVMGVILVSQHFNSTKSKPRALERNGIDPSQVPSSSVCWSDV